VIYALKFEIQHIRTHSNKTLKNQRLTRSLLIFLTYESNLYPNLANTLQKPSKMGSKTTFWKA